MSDECTELFIGVGCCQIISKKEEEILLRISSSFSHLKQAVALPYFYIAALFDPVQECDDLTTRTRCFIPESTVRETFGNLQTHAPEYCGAVSRSD